MKRRVFLKGLPPVLAGPVLFGSMSQISRAAPPLAMSHTSAMNVLFINIDDMAANALGCYGNSIVRTPNLDGFAATAMSFARCYCQTPQGNPSRASVVTGLRPDITGIRDGTGPSKQRLPGRTQSLADLLDQYGIYTVNMGDLFEGSGTAPQLFRSVESHDPALWSRGNVSESQRLPPARDTDRERAEWAAQTIERLASQKRQFFLSLGFAGARKGPPCPSEYVDLYDVNKIPLPQALASADGGPVTDETIRRNIGAYYGHASYVDSQIGIVLEAMEREGLSKNTIVIIFGSHGRQLSEHGLWGKSTLLEQVTHVPLLIRVPGVTTKGFVCDEIVELVDLLPTLCDLLVIPSPDGLEGLSLAPLLVDPRQPWKLAAFSICALKDRIGHSVRTKRWRYTEWQSRETALREFELYDLNSDPWEQRNLARDEGCRNQRTILANLLQRGWHVAHHRLRQDAEGPARPPSYRAHILW